MGLTKDYLRYALSGVCNLVGSANGMVQALDDITCAVSACESINFYNMRTLERTVRIHNEDKGSVTAFKLNDDRSVVAIGYSGGDILAYRRSREKDVTVLTGHKTGVNCLTFSPDGLVLASGGKDSAIILWDLVGEIGLFRLNGHSGSITQLQFTKDGRYLVSSYYSSKDHQLKFWSIASQTCFYTIAEIITEIYSFALLKEDRLLVVGSSELELSVYEIHWLDTAGDGNREICFNSQNPSACDENEGPPMDVAAKRPRTADSLIGADYIAEENEQANTILRCKKRGALVRNAKGKALQIAVSADESIFTCIGNDTLIDVFRVYTAEESEKRFRRKLRKERSRLGVDVASAERLESEIAKDITLLVSRIGDTRLSAKVKWIDICRSVRSTEVEGTVEGKKPQNREYRLYALVKNNDVYGISLKVDWKSGVTKGESVVNLGRCDEFKKTHRSAVIALCTASNGGSFLSCSSESAILWDADSLAPLSCFTHESMKDVSTALFVPGDREILVFTKDGSVFMFDLVECELLFHLEKIHSAAITAAIPLPGRMCSGFITCGYDKQAHFWTYESPMDSSHKLRKTISLSRSLNLPDEALCAATSPNGRLVAFGLLDSTCRIYYLDSLKFFVSLYGHSLPVYSVDISQDSKLIITGSGDKTVKIWGLDFGDCHKSLFAHSDTVTCVRFAEPDEEEKLFWSAGKDGKIKQWDAQKFHRVQVLEGHADEIRALVTSGNGKTLISASNDRSIRVWELTDEIVVLQEEEERAREKEYEAKLVEADDVVPGEPLEKEADLAPIKSIESIKSTENILDAIDVLRNESILVGEKQKYTPHPMLLNYSVERFDHFVLDVLHMVRASHLERSLLLVPYSYIPDILKALCGCVKKHYKSELACRIILFLVKIHHSQVINSVELLPIVDELRVVMPKEISGMQDEVGFNVAALKFLQMQVEERNASRLFKSVASAEAVKAKREQRKKQRRTRIKDTAVVRS